MEFFLGILYYVWMLKGQKNANDLFSDREKIEGPCAPKNENRTFSPKVSLPRYAFNTDTIYTAQAKFLLNFVKFNSVKLKLLRLDFFQMS